MTRHGYFVATGKKVEEIRNIMLGTQKLDQIQDIRGLSACLGRAIGTVRIIKSATETHKVQPGDILVAVMTRPDYIAGMKKAAAIVTDEGGITSHAAIVSRELGIPCLIGTKIATKVFKDGDRAEVNANHGWVRKL
jgi:pyruvate,water dikinase